MSDFDFGVAFQGVQAQFGQKGHEWLGSGDSATTAGDIIKFEVTKADGTPLDAAVTIEGLYATAILEITSDQSNTAAATQP